MKTNFSITLILVLFSLSIFGQNKVEPAKTKPGEQITVNKEFDDQGNLIRFDSTYSFEWHGDTMTVFPEGINPFPHDYFNDMGNLFGGFFSDSLHHSPEFNDDWAKEMFKRQEEYLKNFHHPFDNKDPFFGFSFKSDSLNIIPRNDSIFDFNFNFDGFNFPDMSEFFKEFDNFGNLNNQQFFNDDDQKKEWNELMKRQQKEQEEFQKKWDSKNKGKPRFDYNSHKI